MATAIISGLYSALHRYTVPAPCRQAAKGEAKVEGVGLGAEAAALAYANFDLSTVASWKLGEPVPFALLAATFEQLAGTTKRLEKLRQLATAFWAVLATTPGDLLPFVYLCSNQARALLFLPLPSTLRPIVVHGRRLPATTISCIDGQKVTKQLV